MSDLEAIAAALRENEKFLVVTHENPDGDALGSLLGLTFGLRVLGSEEERQSSLEGLRSSHGVLQKKIATGMRMKRTPTLTFEYDESVDRGDRITRLLEDE